MPIAHLPNHLSILFAIFSFFFSTTVFAESWGLVLERQGPGEGSVCVVYDERDDCPIDDSGNETNVFIDEYVYLRATPNDSSHFVEWSGACKSQKQSCRMLALKPLREGPIRAYAVFGKGSRTRSRTATKAAVPAPTGGGPSPSSKLTPAKSKTSKTKKTNKSQKKKASST